MEEIRSTKILSEWHKGQTRLNVFAKECFLEYVDWEARKIRVELYMLRIENVAEWNETMFTLKVGSRFSSEVDVFCELLQSVV